MEYSFLVLAITRVPKLLFSFLIPLRVLVAPRTRVAICLPRIPQPDKFNCFVCKMDLVHTQNSVSVTGNKAIFIVEHASRHHIIFLFALRQNLPKGGLIVFLGEVHREVGYNWHSRKRPQRFEGQSSGKSRVVLMHFGISLFQNGCPPATV